MTVVRVNEFGARAHVPKTVLIAGVVRLWEGYSNVEKKIEMLSTNDLYEAKLAIKDVAFQISYKTKVREFISIAGMFFTVVFGSISCIISILKNRNYKNIYLPYPGIVLLFLVSLLPRKVVPSKIILDYFISLYDTIVNDRSLISKTSMFARLLYRLEIRAIRRSHVCLVDTRENAEHYGKLFGISVEKFCPIPLSIDEAIYRPVLSAAQDTSRSSRLRILFVGTMVPLQGIPYICDTIRLLKDREEFEFVIVGDGQHSFHLEVLEKELVDFNSKVKLTWIKSWLPSSALMEEIKKSDICLGIFGDNEKTGRVWPFKNYIYMACQKMIITGDTATARRMMQESDSFLTIDSKIQYALHDEFLKVLENRNVIDVYAKQARDFYLEHLSNQIVTRELYMHFV